MNPANRSSTSPPFRLLDLPLELQRIIFRHTLFTKSTLRRPTEAKYYGAVVIFSGTNILRVSSQINKETLPIFYQVNYFHYEHILEFDYYGHVVGVKYLPSTFTRSLHMMRHISIDPIQRQPYRYGREWDWNALAALGDRNLDKILVLIERVAPNLRTLAIHFPPFGTKAAHLRFLMGSINTGGKDNCVVSTLCRLRARLSRLSLVDLSIPAVLEAFRSNIAPLKDWTAQTLESWPVTIDPYTIEGIYTRQNLPEHWIFRIRVWNVCRRP